MSKKLFLQIRNPNGENVTVVYEIDRERLKEAILDPIDFEIDFGDDLMGNVFGFIEMSEAEQKEASIAGLMYSGDAPTREIAIAMIDEDAEEETILRAMDEWEVDREEAVRRISAGEEF